MTIRESLRDAQPHVSLRDGFKALIQRSRALRKQQRPVTIKGRADIDRFLAAPLPDDFDPSGLKQLIWTLLNAESTAEQDKAALAIDAIVSSVNGLRATGEVSLTVSGGPSWLNTEAIDAWLGSQGGHLHLSVRDASAIAHHLEGYVIGGEALKVHSSAALPPVNRADRGRKRARNTSPWLPFIDEVGQYSATPKPIAQAHAQFFATFKRPVFDPFCGLGGDAITFASLGLDVHASELDGGRLSLAKQNAASLGVHKRIQFYAGDGLEHLKAWMSSTPEYLLYLDPPWGGQDWDRKNMRLDTLFPRFECVQRAIENAVAVVLKLPRTFPTDELNILSRQWSFHLGIANNDDHAADRIRLISATSGPS